MESQDIKEIYWRIIEIESQLEDLSFDFRAHAGHILGIDDINKRISALERKLDKGKNRMDETLKTFFITLCVVGAIWLSIYLAGCSSRSAKTVDTLFRTATMIQNNACNGFNGGPSYADQACEVLNLTGRPDICTQIRADCSLGDIARVTALGLADMINDNLNRFTIEKEVQNAADKIKPPENFKLK